MTVLQLQESKNWHRGEIIGTAEKIRETGKMCKRTMTTSKYFAAEQIDEHDDDGDDDDQEDDLIGHGVDFLGDAVLLPSVMVLFYFGADFAPLYLH